MKFFTEEKIFNNRGKCLKITCFTSKCRYCSYYPRCKKLDWSQLEYSYILELYEIAYKRF